MSSSPEDNTDPSAEQLAPGSRVRSYQITSLHRSGSFGEIYAARHLQTGKTVKIKRSRTRHRTEVDPVRREAEVLSNLDHPNVVGLQDFWEETGKTYLVLENLEGADLEQTLRDAETDLDENALQDLMRSLADAAQAIHEAGYLHNDLKPGNIMIRGDGSPVIVDFGSAAKLGGSGSAGRTWTDVTAGYAAPEQYIQEGKEGPWTDVYSLGAIAYRIIAGSPPPAARERMRGTSHRPTLEAGRGRFSDALLHAVDWALGPEPADRPQTVRAWERALSDAASLTEAPRRESSRISGGSPEDPYPPTERVERLPVTTSTPTEPKVLKDVPRHETTGRGSIILWALLFVVASLAALGWSSRPLYYRYLKTTWVVDPAGGGDAVTVSEALSQAPDDATILIRPGVYQEGLVLPRPVHLRAEQGHDEAPVIAPPHGPCLVATAGSGSVLGLRFRGAAAPGAKLSEGVPCLDLAGGAFIVEGNEITSLSGPGLRLREGADPTIRGNRISKTAGPGIVVKSGARGTVVKNTIERVAKSGIIVRGGAAPHIADNRIADSGHAGALFAEGAGGLFAANIVVSSGRSGIEVTSGADPVVAKNRIEASGEAGIFVYDDGRGWFQGNEIATSTHSGLVIAAGAAPRFVDNLVRDGTEHGVLAIERSGGVVADNRIAGNDGHGIVRVWQSDVEFGINQLEGNKEPQLLEGWMSEGASGSEPN